MTISSKLKPLVHPKFGTLIDLAHRIEDTILEGTYPEEQHVAAVAWFIQELSTTKIEAK